MIETIRIGMGSSTRVSGSRWRMALEIAKNRAAAGISFALILSALLFFMIQGIGKASRPEGNDFTGYLSAASLLLQGECPYRADLYYPARYPLFLPFALSPFLLLPLPVATGIWVFVIALALGWSVWTLFRLTQPPDMPARAMGLPAILALLFLIPALQNNFMNGQVNALTLLFCVLFLEAHIQRRAVMAALFLAIAISLKIAPVLLLLYLAVRRETTTIGYTLLFTLLLCLAPMGIVGTEIFGMYGEFLRESLVPYLFKGMLDHPHTLHFSLYGFLAYFWPTLSGNAIIEWILILAAVGLLLAAERFALNRKGREVWMFSFYLLAILLINPISETHHLIFILPASLLTLFHLFFKAESVDGFDWLGALMCAGLYYTGVFLESPPFFFLTLAVLWIVNLRIAGRPVHHDDSIAFP